MGLKATDNDAWQIARCDEGCVYIEGRPCELTLDEKRANARLIAAAPEMQEVLEGYEKWEADLILTNKVWVGGNPVIIDELYDKMIELQTMRNAALAKARGEE